MIKKHIKTYKDMVRKISTSKKTVAFSKKNKNSINYGFMKNKVKIIGDIVKADKEVIDLFNNDYFFPKDEFLKNLKK